jgi:hypothetical protein
MRVVAVVAIPVAPPYATPQALPQCHTPSTDLQFETKAADVIGL